MVRHNNEDGHLKFSDPVVLDEQKKMEIHNILQQSRERYKAAFEYTGTGMMIINEDMTILELNKRISDFTGYTHEEIEGKRKWYEFVVAQEKERMIEFHQKRRVDPGAAPTEYECQYISKRGEILDALITASMIPGTKNSLVSMIDITERKKIERALRTSEEKYRELFENANDIIYTHDVNGNFTSANRAALQTYGYTLEEILSLNITDIIDPSFHTIALEQVKYKVTTGSTSQPYEILTRTKTGKPVWLEVYSRPIEHDGKIIGIQGIVRNITERKAIEQKLVEEQQRFRETLELVPSIICEIDVDYKFAYVNKTGLERFGYAQEELAIGVNVLSIVPEEDRDRMVGNIRYLFSTDAVHSSEYKLYHRDGSLVDYLAIASRVVRKGEMKGIRCCLVDIAERKAMELQLEKSEQQLRSAFAASPIGIATFGSSGSCVQMNRAFKTMFGIDPTDGCVAINFNLFRHVTDVAQCTEKLWNGEVLHFESSDDFAFKQIEHEYRYIKVSARVLEWHVTPMGDEDNDTLMFLAHVQDITEKKKLEEARVQKATFEAHRVIEGLRREILQKSQFHDMVSRSPAMQKIFTLIPEVAQTATSVLITGESGTGKELIARSIHDMSARVNKPFVAINCGALPDNLLESELFGYSAGAFTDAKKDKPGKFSLANSGTIFLDEIGDISPAMQVKLLRVLQERSFEPLGATRSLSVDVRILTATNKCLLDMVKNGLFREDLYYRIKVVQITLPALRDRKCDIPLLVDHFITVYNARFKKSIEEVSKNALDILFLYNYPGNIRELENIMEHAFIFCKGSTIEPHHLPPELVQTILSQEQKEVVPILQERKTDDMFQSVAGFDELERKYILYMLQKAGGNKVKTATMLNMHKTTLFRKMKSLGIEHLGEKA